MKKIWLAFFVGLFMVGLAACGGDPEKDKPADPTSVKQEAVDAEEEALQDDFEAFKKQRKEDYQK